MVLKENTFAEFSFNELINFVSTISRTKKQSSVGVWKHGHGLESIEKLEENVDDVLFELTKRVKESWSLSRIQRNFSRSGINLPSEILNIFNITTTELNKKLFKRYHTIGAEENDGFDEIWLVLGNNRYLMNKKGIIEIKKMPSRD